LNPGGEAEPLQEGRSNGRRIRAARSFDRWEQVWHEGKFDLVPGRVGPHYLWQDEAGDRTVTREAFRHLLVATL
jgi:hypothetical protein